MKPSVVYDIRSNLLPSLALLKLPDVCYSWWVLASLKIIGRIHWIDKSKLRSFILACQDDETGGFADRPGDMVRYSPPVTAQCSFPPNVSPSAVTTV